MNNRVREQFLGFVNTHPLWEDYGAFGLSQFDMPPVSTRVPTETEILNHTPALAHKFVLGKRIEGFFSFQINRSSGFRLLTQNLQIVQDKATIGEIDFIIEDIKSQVKFHIELVYKFYLYDQSVDGEINKWIGPNRKDSLPQKITKLKEKQLPLLFRRETTRMLSHLGINYKEVQQLVCFKANLFVPLAMMGKSLPIINNSCICGYWIYRHEFTAEVYSGNRFYMPKKTDWPIDPVMHDEWLLFTEIIDRVQELINQQISPLVWMKTPEGVFHRIFIVWWHQIA